MSLQTIVSSGLVDRLHVRRGSAAVAVAPRARRGAMRLPVTSVSVGSMRILEAAIAMTALATALLMGMGR